MAIIQDLLKLPSVQSLQNYPQHHHSDRLTHSIHVSYRSYLIAKKLHLDYRAAARGGLLHDLFYYDWHYTTLSFRKHVRIHPKIALHNACKLTKLSRKEKDIIVKHMFGYTFRLPRYAESYIVSFVDDYEAIADFTHPYKVRFEHSIKY